MAGWKEQIAKNQQPNGCRSNCWERKRLKWCNLQGTTPYHYWMFVPQWTQKTSKLASKTEGKHLWVDRCTFWMKVKEKDTTFMSESRYTAVPLQENISWPYHYLVLKICQNSLKFRNLKGALRHKNKEASWWVQRRTAPEWTQIHKHQGKQEGDKCKSSLPE